MAHYGSRLWRCKGVIHAAGRRVRLILQGVQGQVLINGGTMWRPFEPRRTVLVFIGQGLEGAFIEEQLTSALAV